MIDSSRGTSIAVLGGGAAGIVAAISAKRAGSSVVICERLPRLGKKILASGNGRCNLLNENLSDSFYNPASRSLVRSVFSKFGKNDILNFFKSLGLETHSEEGRIFPVTNQSSSVLKVLEIELKKFSIPVELNFEVNSITAMKGAFILASKSGRKISCAALIIAGGGKSYPALGSDGSSYKFAEELGHKIVAPVPSAVPVVAKDPLCHLLQGQKIFAAVKVVIGDSVVAEASGDLLFTKYGLSGTAILDISRIISIALSRPGKKAVTVRVDMTPFMNEARLKNEFDRRLKCGFPVEELCAGILPDKFSLALSNILKGRDTAVITNKLKAMEFNVTGTRGWNEADFTAGGVDVQEVEAGTMASKITKGLYFAGEVLDVDGCRGGYNLAWAWASGYVAGESAGAFA